MNNVSIDPGWVVAPLDVFCRDTILTRSEERVLPLVPAYVDIVRVDRATQIDGLDG